jgi:hypothetical protein
MFFLLAQASEQPPPTGPIEFLSLALFLGSLLVLPLLLVLLGVVMFRYTKHMKAARAHIERSEVHMERVEGLLGQIARNTGSGGE